MRKRKTEFVIPAELKYTKLSEWVKIEGNVLTLGITDFAQDQIGDINSIPEFPKIGTEVNPLFEQEHKLTAQREGKTSTVYIPGKTVALIDCSKGVFYAYSPVRGRILEVNTDLSGWEAGAVVNKDPYDKGWLVKIEILDPTPLEKLLDAAGYKKFIRGE